MVAAEDHDEPAMDEGSGSPPGSAAPESAAPESPAGNAPEAATEPVAPDDTFEPTRPSGGAADDGRHQLAWMLVLVGLLLLLSLSAVQTFATGVQADSIAFLALRLSGGLSGPLLIAGFVGVVLTYDART